MTPEIAKELLPIIKAFSEGKQIQYFDSIYKEWANIESPIFDENPSKYRIKPEPKYRSFKSVEECWKEMKNHYPFGWLKSKTSLEYRINNISKYMNFDNYFNVYTFADGSPFGIKEK